MASSASALPWLWVIEALASSKEVDSSILIDLVKRTPEISDDLGKNAREMVSLRILESFVAQPIRNTKGVSSAPDSKIEFDLSEHCEDIVRHIVHEISASNVRMDEQEMLKWDVETFIMHKRACLPKCTLQQLKNAILKGNQPILASLKERSGLSISNQSENRIAEDDGDAIAVAGILEGRCSDGQTMAAGGNLTSPTPENSDSLLREDSPNINLLPSKRDRSDLDTENQAAKSHEDHIIVDNECDPHLHNVKKLKQDANFTGQAVGQKSLSVIGNELSEDLFRSKGQHNGREGSDLAKSSQVGGLEESRFSEGGHDQHVPSKSPGQRNDADDTGFHLNHPRISCDNNTMPQDTSGDGLHGNLSVNEAKDDGEHCAEMRTSNAAPLGGTHQNICGDEARDRCEKSQLNISNGVPLDESYRNNFPGEAKDDMEHNPGQEMSSDSDGYQDEKVDVAMKKHTFLSSQCTFSQDSLATSDCTELNLCMKCNKGGQLLVCSASACPLVIHRSCLGSAPSFDDSGNFYCPFCAYSHAISKYIEVKKKASLARKDLASFIGLENGQRANKFSRRFLRPQQNQMRQDDNVNGNNRANHSRNHVNEVNSSQFRENIEDKREVEPSASCVNGNLPCGEGVATVNDGRLLVLIEHNREGGKMGPESQYTSVLEGQQIEALDGCKVGDDDSSCRDRETVHVTKRRADGIQEGVLPQPLTDSPQQATSQPNIDAEGSSKEENDKPTSSYFIRFRRREKKYTYPAIPQLRRKKVPWTAVEEETLKEGVRRFSSVHDRNIPWKSILEFGSDVFQKGRTTIDLKDKWRNICRGSPKSK